MTEDIDALHFTAVVAVNGDGIGKNSWNFNSTPLNLFLLSHFMCFRLSLSMAMVWDDGKIKPVTMMVQFAPVCHSFTRAEKNRVKFFFSFIWCDVYLTISFDTRFPIWNSPSTHFNKWTYVHRIRWWRAEHINQSVIKCHFGHPITGNRKQRRDFVFMAIKPTQTYRVYREVLAFIPTLLSKSEIPNYKVQSQSTCARSINYKCFFSFHILLDYDTDTNPTLLSPCGKEK